MKSLSQLLNSTVTFSQNSSSGNQQTMMDLLNEQHRLLIEKYFDNERQYVTSTVGAMNLDISANLAGGALNASLSGTWQYPTGQQQVTFANVGGITATLSANAANLAVTGVLTANWAYPTGLQSVTFGNANSDVRDVLFTNGSTAISWTIPLTGATTSTTITTNTTSQILQVNFEYNSTSISWVTPLIYSCVVSTGSPSIATSGFQKYRIPSNISKITDSTISVGQLRFVPAPVQTRSQWDLVNFLPYSSDIPNYFYIYNGFVEFWPIPSTTGNQIAFNYKARVPDFSTAFLFNDISGTPFTFGNTSFDYQVGSLSGISVGSINVTGASTAWNSTGKYPLNVDLTPFNLYLQINAPNGDNLWYPIYQFTSDTALQLASPIQSAPSATTSANGYSIAQLPVLQEDFHQTLVWGTLLMYFSTIVPDVGKYKQIKQLYDERIEMLAEYAGTKQVNYDLGAEPLLITPGLYPFYPNGVSG